MRRTMLLPVITALTLVPLVAHAQAPGETAPLAEPATPAAPAAETVGAAGEVEIHYGKQIVVADLITLGATTAGFIAVAGGSGNGGEGGAMMLGMGLSSWMLTAPIIHLVHGDTKAAGISLVLRGGLPWALGMAFRQLGPKDTYCGTTPSGRCSNQTANTGTVIGAAVGAFAAMYLDSRYNSTHREAAPARFAPTVGYAPGGLTLGVGGAF
jgi:hypothetical protein